METHYTTGAPCVELYDAEKFLIGANQQYINARKKLKIDIHKLYLWWYRSVWDCDLSISASAKVGQGLFGPYQGIQNYYTTKIQSVKKVGVVQHSRDRKTPIVNTLGKTTLIDDKVNPLPKGYPKNILYNVRSNPCHPIIGSTVYFDCPQRVENSVYNVVNKGDPMTRFDSDAFENISTKKINYENGRYDFHLFSGTKYLPIKCEIYLDPSKTVYDYSLKKYIPDVFFGLSPVTWIGLLPSGNPSTNFTKKSTLSVNGISIESDTDFNYGAYAGSQDPEEFGHLDISLKWKISKERDL
jgi:hypothetical protein